MLDTHTHNTHTHTQCHTDNGGGIVYCRHEMADNIIDVRHSHTRDTQHNVTARVATRVHRPILFAAAAVVTPRCRGSLAATFTDCRQHTDYRLSLTCRHYTATSCYATATWPPYSHATLLPEYYAVSYVAVM